MQQQVSWCLCHPAIVRSRLLSPSKEEVNFNVSHLAASRVMKKDVTAYFAYLIQQLEFVLKSVASAKYRLPI